MAQLVVPSVLAAQADGRARFELEAATLGEALCALPFADLLFDARGEWRQQLKLYVDGDDAHDLGGLERPLAGVREVRIVAMIAGG